MQFIT